MQKEEQIFWGERDFFSFRLKNAGGLKRAFTLIYNTVIIESEEKV